MLNNTTGISSDSFLVPFGSFELMAITIIKLGIIVP